MNKRIDPAVATPGHWVAVPLQQTMHDRRVLPTYAVITTGEKVTEAFIGRVHAHDGRPDEWQMLRMDAQLFAASKRMAELLQQALAFAADQFDAEDDAGDDVSVDGGDMVVFFAGWRAEVKALLDGTAPDPS